MELGAVRGFTVVCLCQDACAHKVEQSHETPSFYFRARYFKSVSNHSIGHKRDSVCEFQKLDSSSLLQHHHHHCDRRGVPGLRGKASFRDLQLPEPSPQHPLDVTLRTVQDERGRLCITHTAWSRHGGSLPSLVPCAHEEFFPCQLSHRLSTAPN